MLNIITPTSDRLVGMDLLAKRIPFGEIWIVADDGKQHFDPSGYPHLNINHLPRHHDERTPVQSFRANLLDAIQYCTPGYVIFCEDDDWYSIHHFTDIVHRLEKGNVAAGDTCQRYYNIEHRVWKQFTNVGSTLAQTGFRTELLPLFQQAVLNPAGKDGRGVDAAFWKLVMESGLPHDLFNGDEQNTPFVVGIKGLPGKPGIGVGHRPDETWTPDPELVKLQQWIGDESKSYASL